MQKIARRKIAAYVAKQLQSGESTRSIATHVAAYLVEQKQTGSIELLLRDVEALLESEFGIVTARVRSAHPLDSTTRATICDTLKKQIAAKDVIIVSEQVEPELIGGVIIETPSSVFDSSIHTQLQQLAAITKE